MKSKFPPLTVFLTLKLFFSFYYVKYVKSYQCNCRFHRQNLKFYLGVERDEKCFHPLKNFS